MAETLGVRDAPRQACIDLAEHRAGEAGRAAPQKEGAGRKLRVDEGDGNAAPFRLEDQIRPEFAARDERDIRAPPGEERAEETGRVERRELM